MFHTYCFVFLYPLSIPFICLSLPFSFSFFLISLFFFVSVSLHRFPSHPSVSLLPSLSFFSYLCDSIYLSLPHAFLFSFSPLICRLLFLFFCPLLLFLFFAPPYSLLLFLSLPFSSLCPSLSLSSSFPFPLIFCLFNLCLRLYISFPHSPSPSSFSLPLISLHLVLYSIYVSNSLFLLPTFLPHSSFSVSLLQNLFFSAYVSLSLLVFFLIFPSLISFLYLYSLCPSISFRLIFSSP
jgi:hypothetical protein